MKQIREVKNEKGKVKNESNQHQRTIDILLLAGVIPALAN